MLVRDTEGVIVYSFRFHLPNICLERLRKSTKFRLVCVDSKCRDSSVGIALGYGPTDLLAIG